MVQEKDKIQPTGTLHYSNTDISVRIYKNNMSAQ